jgi:hypothetical protein
LSRHADIKTTFNHYVENKKRSLIGFSRLLKGERTIIPIDDMIAYGAAGRSASDSRQNLACHLLATFEVAQSSFPVDCLRIHESIFATGDGAAGEPQTGPLRVAFPPIEDDWFL